MLTGSSALRSMRVECGHSILLGKVWLYQAKGAVPKTPHVVVIVYACAFGIAGATWKLHI